jgi:hypothetical protein
MDLYLRKVPHAQAHNDCRVTLKLVGDEIEIGSIGVQNTAGLSATGPGASTLPSNAKR